MNPGFKYFWVFGVNIDKWCQRHDLEPFVGACMDCGKPLVINQPFAGPDDIRGLGLDQCDHCESNYTPFTYVGGMCKELR